MALSSPGFRKVVANKARHLIFFEQSGLVFNYKTGEWARVPAYDGSQMFTINDPNAVIGLIKFDSSNDVEVATQGFANPQEALLETGFNKFDSRVLVNGVRPLVRGGETETRVTTTDTFNASDSPSPWQYVESRSGMAHFRKEGRYLKVEMRLNDFETAIGFEADAKPAGSL